MITHFKKTASVLWKTAIFSIIAIGLVLGAVRLLAPLAGNLKPFVESSLGKTLQQPVTISQISTYWTAHGPELMLQGLQIGDNTPESPAIRLKRIDLELDFSQALSTGPWLNWNLELHDVNIEIQRNTDGLFHIAGIGMSGSTATDVDIIPALLSIHRLKLSNASIVLRDQMKSLPLTHLNHVNLELRNRQNRHRIQGKLFLNHHQQSQELSVAADITTNPDGLADWQGDIYWKLSHGDISDWMTELLPDTTRLDSARLSTEIWTHWKKGQLQNLEGQADIKDLEITPRNQPQQITVDRISGNFRWQKAVGHRQLDIEDLNIIYQGTAWPVTGISLKQQLVDETKQLSLSIDHVDLKQLGMLIQQFPLLLQDSPKDLSGLILGGELKNLQLSKQDSDDRAQWFVSTDLDAVSIDGLDEFPVLKNLSGHLESTDKTGFVNLDSHNSEIYYPSMFRAPFELLRLSGQIDWTVNTEGDFSLQSRSLEAITPHIETRSRLLLKIPAKGPAWMDMQTRFQNGNGTARQIRTYFPVSIMPKNLIHWLDHALVGGKVSQGSFIFRGPLGDFPFEQTRNGHFEVLFDVEDFTLAYLDDWPALKNIDAEVHFLNNSLAIHATSATLLDSKVSATDIIIPAFGDTPKLLIKGHVEGPLQDGLKILSSGELGDTVAAITSSLKAQGNNQLDLDIRIPLETPDKLTLKGNLRLTGNRLEYPARHIRLKQLGGHVRFSQSGIRKGQLKASLAGSPITIDFHPHGKNGSMISARSHLDARQLTRLIREIPENTLSGETDWMLKLLVPDYSAKHPGPVKLQLESDLQGLGITLPAPMQKPAGIPEKLRLAMTFKDNSLPVKASIGKNRFFKGLFSPGKTGAFEAKRLQLHFGKPLSTRKDQHNAALSLSGNIDFFDIKAWADWLEQFPRQQQKPDIPFQVELDSKKIVYRQHEINDCKLKAYSTEKNIVGNLRCRQIDGSFQIPLGNTQRPLKASAKYVLLEFDPDSEDTPTPEHSATTIDPAGLPPLQITVDKLSINGKNFGKARLQTKQTINGLYIKQLSLTGDLVNITSSGSWTQKNRIQESQSRFDIKVPAVGEFVEKLGYTPQINAGDANIKGELSWSGGPAELADKLLSGKIQLDIREGRFIDVEPGAGRLLGLLNIAAITRRLTLDFSDIFKKGLTFDQISADFKLDKGQVYTDNLKISSPAATVEIRGRTSIIDKDFDQLITVTPSLQSTITIIGAVTGGPAGAAIAYLAQKLVGNEVDKIAKTKYSLKGSWQNPEITEIGKPAQKDKNANASPRSVFPDEN